MANKAAELQPKHWKALEMFEDGFMSIKEIGKACGIAEDTIYDLFEGNDKKVGTIAHLFKEELNQMTARNATKVKHLTKDNKKLALYKMNEFLRGLQKTKSDPAMMKDVVRCMNTLNKSTPQVEMSLSITKGMTAEELKNEFKRLHALAEFASRGGSIRGLKSGESGRIPEPPQ